MKRPFGQIWLDTFLARKKTRKTPNRDMSGKLIVFTGGTDGMGRAAVERFAEMGASICLIARNPEKTLRVLNELSEKNYQGQFSMVECDLGSLAQVRHAANEVLSRFNEIHYLINCAGINVAEYQLSPDGIEMNFAVNFLGPFLLTELLFDRVSARIVNLTSGTQEVAKLDFDDIQLENNWSLLKSYAQAKLCVIMHGRNLAARVQDSEVSIHSLNPGYIATNLALHSKGIEGLFTTLFGRLAAPAWVGGERIVAATLEDNYQTSSGEFIYEDMLLPPNPIALDNEKVKKLMKLSYRLAKLDDNPFTKRRCA